MTEREKKIEAIKRELEKWEYLETMDASWLIEELTREIELNAEMREIFKDLAKNGLRADLYPTQPMGDWEEVTRFFLSYLKKIDSSLRERARSILASYEKSIAEGESDV